jgi:hypothetical protein
VIPKMSSESAIAKNIRLNPLELNEEIKRLEELPNQIRALLQKLGKPEIFDAAVVQYARTLGPKSEQENLNQIVRKEMIELAKKYLDYFESISSLDIILQDLSGQTVFHDDWTDIGSEKLLLMIEVVWGRKLGLCNVGKNPRMTNEEKDMMVAMLDDSEKELGKNVIDVINSPLFYGSVHAARKLIQYLSLDEQTRTDLNTGVLNMVIKVSKQANALRIKQGFDTIALKLPSEGPNTGI